MALADFKLPYIGIQTKTNRIRGDAIMGAYRKPPRILATCRLCGEPVMSNQSYHSGALGISHLRCEYSQEAAGNGHR